jgi:tripartite-type tricarboxylate transporter receptor subunit TctC
MKRAHIAATALAMLLAVAMPGPGCAQAMYPSHTVEIIVPYPPGGATDILARVLAQKLSEKWKQPVIVENLGGAGGNLGAAKVAQAAPDGYTLLFASPGPLATNSLMYKIMPYDPANWVPIAMPGTAAYLLTVSPNFGASNLAQVIADAKAKPGQVTAAVPGVGSLGQFATIEFELLAHVKLLQVPYQGINPAQTDLLGGHVNIMFTDIVTALPLYRAGKLKIVAVGTTARVPELPDVPTLTESGLPGYRAVTFYGLVAPPGTPTVLADRINGDVVEAMKQPAFLEKIKALTITPSFGSRTEAGKFFADERKLWSKVAKEANIRPVQ